MLFPWQVESFKPFRNPLTSGFLLAVAVQVDKVDQRQKGLDKGHKDIQKHDRDLHLGLLSWRLNSSVPSSAGSKNVLKET